MTDDLAQFRTLKGIGPATEARLHAAGVYRWESLAEIVNTLGSIRLEDPLREIGEQLGERVNGSGGPNGEESGPERLEAFIVRLALTEPGRPERSTVIHVRSEAEQAFRGWRPDELVDFVEKHAGMADDGADDGPPPPEGEPATRDHLVLLSAGKVIGGSRRDVDVAVSTAELSGQPEFEYRARLKGRRLGESMDWTVLAERSGQARPPGRVPLHFTAIDLPVGVQRLQLEMAVRLASATTEQPRLTLG